MEILYSPRKIVIFDFRKRSKILCTEKKILRTEKKNFRTEKKILRREKKILRTEKKFLRTEILERINSDFPSAVNPL